jgi:hypothetical protein
MKDRRRGKWETGTKGNVIGIGIGKKTKKYKKRLRVIFLTFINLLTTKLNLK